MNYLSDRSRDYTLAKDVRIFGMRGWLEDVYTSTLRMLRSFAAREERIYLWGNVADVLFTFLRNGLVYFFLISSVLYGEVSPGEFVLYFNAVGIFTGGLSGILGGLAELGKQSLDLLSVREFLEFPEPFLLEGGTPLVPDVNAPYTIELRDVSFRYPEAECDTLSHINLTISAGTSLAVVGLKGAGKTTLIKLICGFLDPTEGEVLLNGRDVRTLNRRDYYRLFSAVFQDFSLLDATIAENIAQTEEQPDLARMARCVEQAGLTEKIKGLPAGLDTHLGKVFEDGIELSGRRGAKTDAGAGPV